MFADEGLVRTDRNGVIDTYGNYGADGILGPHREKEASFHTIKALWSPVEIEGRRLPAAFDGRLPVRNGYSFTDLKDCTFTWQLLSFGAPGSTGDPHKVGKEGRAASPAIAPTKAGVLELGLPPDWRSTTRCPCPSRILQGGT